MNGEEFTRARRTLTEQLVAALTALWASLGSWRGADVDRFLEAAVPLVLGAQRTMADLTVLWVADEASRVTGVAVAPPMVPDQAVTDLRDGVTVEEAYRRPFEQTWTGLSRGDDVADAVDRGRARLVGLAEFDMQEAHAHAARESMQRLPDAAKPSWWRRVPVGEETCALCLVASTRVYTLAELNPMHPGCDCRVEPQYGTRPAMVADGDFLERVEKAVAEELGREGVTSAAELRELLVEVTEDHGELGRVLRRPKSRRRPKGD